MSLRIGSLCSGYGGLDLGVQFVLGGTVAWHVEYDRDPSKILAHHWPDIPNHGDVKHTDWVAVEPVDILTAGYPCQPFSHAGKRKGSDDPRHLWPDVARAVGALRPGLVVLENVAGHVSLGLADVLGDLSALGYDARWGVVRAADAGAPHGRARIFIVAAPDTGIERPHGSRGARGARSARSWWSDAAGLADAPADAGSDDSMGRRDAGAVRRVAGEAEGGARERERARGATGGRGEEAHGRLSVEWGDAPRSAGTTADAEGSRVAYASESGREPDASGGLRGVPTLGQSAEIEVGEAHGRLSVEWGAYGPAVERWAAILGRPAPLPTEPGRDDRPRLSALFVEWLMGLEEGHVTGTPDLSRSAQLKALGNGVVPQQAALALRLLLNPATEAAA